MKIEVMLFETKHKNLVVLLTKLCVPEQSESV